ncbi:MAG TPA: chromate resistance protein ChrB domain-containing protein [Gemmatimonadales bacterium]|nr:chromate resistance protein ChrB domain-containing protein [Gemmatimonadales bacterium]
MRPSAVNRWVLLIHQIPPKPDYFRVKVWRRLQRVGAVAIKNSVYVLPRSDETVEDFQWQMREIVAGGGEASVCEASFVDGLSDAEVEALFRAARDADYGEVVADAQRLLKATPTRGGRRAPTEGRGSIEAEIGRLKRRLAGVVAIDFFGAPSRQVAHEELGRLEMRLRPSGDAIPPPPTPPAPAPRGATWVTRLGVHVDRIASAWLIRRFIDPKAQFKFVAPDGYRPRPGELRFDMFEAEYTHEGDACTFETLVARFGLGEPAVRVIAQIVHDIDCKEAKFGRPETPGIERLIAGIAQQHQEDSARVDLGAALFDALYAALTGTAGDTSRRATKRRGARKRSKPSPR